MLAQWIADVSGKMRVNNVKQKEFAEHLGCTPEYICAVLNGKRTPKGAEAKFRTELDELLRSRQDHRTSVMEAKGETSKS